ncbi:hypothetical protein BDV32DRAFT_117450 [Aspergillus pseudonomiae]|nr:hypothetical protein BDV32DRAFT_117450 [Aspergillus pseudonomiae]
MREVRGSIPLKSISFFPLIFLALLSTVCLFSFPIIRTRDLHSTFIFSFRISLSRFLPSLIMH